MVSTRTRLVASTLVGLLVVSMALSGAVLAAPALSIGVTQDQATGQATVTVTSNGTAVDNASVQVTSADGYDGTGNYTTDANGTVTLPNPSQPVNVTIAVSTDAANATKSVSLTPLDRSLAVSVASNADRSAVVTVTQYGTPVENASVNVSAAGNDSYAGAGTYATDANGAVSLPTASHTVTVDVSATAGNLTAITSATLQGPGLAIDVSQAADGSVTIVVSNDGQPADGANVTVSGGNYSYAGTYTADNGTVSLGAPSSNVTIDVTATYANVTANTTATLTTPTASAPGHSGFADMLVQFINYLRAHAGDGPLGQQISAFVHEHNPSQADNHRGPSEHAQANGHGTESSDNGTAANATANGGDHGEHGPGANAHTTGQGASEHDNANGHAKDKKHGGDHAGENESD